MITGDHTLHILSGDLWAGKEYQVVALLSGMRELGQERRILLFNDGETAKRCREVGASVVVADEKRGIASLISAGKTLAAPRVIIVHGYKEAFVGWVLTRHFGARLVAVHHGMIESSWSIRARIYNLIWLLISRFAAHRIVFVSEDLRSRLGFNRSDRAFVIHNSLNGNAEGLAVGSPERGHVVFCGRLVAVKRLDFALRSFKRALNALPKNISLLVIGDGPERTFLEELSRREGIAERVRFLGYRTDARDIIASASCLVISSEHEGIPTVMLEAMQAGVPIVATAVGGIVEIARLFPSFPISLVQYGDVDALSKALVGISSAEYDLGKLPIPTEDKQRFQSYFSPMRLAQDYHKLISELV